MKQLEEQCYYIVFNISANKHLDKIFIARQEAEEYAQTFIYKDDKYKIIPLVLLSDAEQILKQVLEEVEKNIKPIEQKFKENFDLRVRVTKQEVISLIANFTYNDRNFDVTFWSNFDAERLIKAGELIKSQLKEGK